MSFDPHWSTWTLWMVCDRMGSQYRFVVEEDVLRYTVFRPGLYSSPFDHWLGKYALSVRWFGSWNERKQSFICLLHLARTAVWWRKIHTHVTGLKLELKVVLAVFWHHRKLLKMTWWIGALHLVLQTAYCRMGRQSSRTRPSVLLHWCSSSLTASRFPNNLWATARWSYAVSSSYASFGRSSRNVRCDLVNGVELYLVYRALP